MSRLLLAPLIDILVSLPVFGVRRDFLALRHVDQVLPGANLFWYSGGTERSDRGCLMAYVHTPDGHWPWYVDLQRTAGWNVAECIGIGPGELEAFHRRCNREHR